MRLEVVMIPVPDVDRDVVRAQAELSDRGSEIEDVRHIGVGGWLPGPHPDRADHAANSGFADPDANTSLTQKAGHEG